MQQNAQETMEQNKGLKDPSASKYISMITESSEKLLLELTFENEQMSLKNDLLKKQYDNRMEDFKKLSAQENQICEDRNIIKINDIRDKKLCLQLTENQNEIINNFKITENAISTMSQNFKEECKKYKEMTLKHSELNKRYAECEENNKKLKSDINKSIILNTNLTDEMNTMEKMVEEHDDKIEGLSNLLNEYLQKNDEISKQIDDAKKVNIEFKHSAELEILKTSNNNKELQITLNELESKVLSTKTLYNTNFDKKECIQNANNKLSEEVEVLKLTYVEENKSTDLAVTELSNDIDTINEIFIESKNKFASMVKINDKLNYDLNQINDNLQAASNKLNEQLLKIDSLKAACVENTLDLKKISIDNDDLDNEIKNIYETTVPIQEYDQLRQKLKILKHEFEKKNIKILPSPQIISKTRNIGDHSFRSPSQPKRNSITPLPHPVNVLPTENEYRDDITSTSGIHNSIVLHTNTDEAASSGGVSKKRKERVTSSSGSDVSKIFRNRFGDK